MELQGFGVARSGTRHRADSGARLGFILVLWLVQYGAGGWGQSQAVTSLVLKAVSRDIFVFEGICATAYDNS